MNVLIITGFKTPTWAWNKVKTELDKNSKDNIKIINYKDYSNYAYNDTDLYIFNSLACRLNIAKERLDKSVYLFPAFKVMYPYNLAIKKNQLYRKPLDKIGFAALQVDSFKRNIVTGNIYKSSVTIKTKTQHFDFITHPKGMAKTIIKIIERFR